MNNHNDIVATVARKGDVAQTTPHRFVLVQRAAAALSLRNVDAATTELLNEALGRATMLCYERGNDGQLCNVDAPTGRVLVPLPWGRAGYKVWGLTASESNVLRRIMLDRQSAGLPLFGYDRSRRSWFLNIEDYPDGAQIVATLREWEIAVGEYRAARIKTLDNA